MSDYLNILLNYVIFVYIFYRFVNYFNRSVNNVNGLLLNTFDT